MPLRHLVAEESPTTRADRGPSEYLAMQSLTRELAFDPNGWTPERLDRIRRLFDELAPEWHTRGGEDRRRPLRDALARGGLERAALCVEIGSGTGLQTPPMLEHFAHVVSIDLSASMLELAPKIHGVDLVRADASRLPIRTGAVEVIVCVNAFLFPAEYARVLSRRGRIVFVSVSGEQTPIYLSPADVLAAMEGALGPCDGVTSRVGFGIWTVVWRRETSD
jgi:hypothetical protein